MFSKAIQYSGEFITLNLKYDMKYYNIKTVITYSYNITYTPLSNVKYSELAPYYRTKKKESENIVKYSFEL